MCVRTKLIPDFTAVGKISRSSFVDISKHTTFGRMDEQTWIETKFVGGGNKKKRYKNCLGMIIKLFYSKHKVFRGSRSKCQIFIEIFCDKKIRNCCTPICSALHFSINNVCHETLLLCFSLFFYLIVPTGSLF